MDALHCQRQPGIERAVEDEHVALGKSREFGDGHLAAVFVSFERKPSHGEIIERWRSYIGRPQLLGLPSAPSPFLAYFEDDARPQTRLDRDLGSGMGVSIGRLREDGIFDYRFVALSHNTVRGAAGGAVLTAELLMKEGYLAAK